MTDRDAINRLLDYLDHLDSVGALTGAVSDKLRALIKGLNP
jgi:hypothetical protein